MVCQNVNEFWNDLPAEQRPAVTFSCAIVQHGMGDVFFTLLSKEDWESMPEDAPFAEALQDVPCNRQAFFSDLGVFLKFVKENNIDIIETGQGRIY